MTMTIGSPGEMKIWNPHETSLVLLEGSIMMTAPQGSILMSLVPLDSTRFPQISVKTDPSNSTDTQILPAKQDIVFSMSNYVDPTNLTNPKISPDPLYRGPNFETSVISGGRPRQSSTKMNPSRLFIAPLTQGVRGAQTRGTSDNLGGRNFTECVRNPCSRFPYFPHPHHYPVSHLTPDVRTCMHDLHNLCMK